jgi:hypothetical protein
MASTVMASASPYGPALRATPVKSGIPASANQQGYLEIESMNIESLPTAPTVGK